MGKRRSVHRSVCGCEEGDRDADRGGVHDLVAPVRVGLCDSSSFSVGLKSEKPRAVGGVDSHCPLETHTEKTPSDQDRGAGICEEAHDGELTGGAGRSLGL